MRGRGLLVAQGLLARGSRGGYLNEALKYPPLVFSFQARTVSTAQEKADTRAMLDRMLRFGFEQFKRHTSLTCRVDHAGEFGADRIYAGQMAVLGDTEVSFHVLTAAVMSISGWSHDPAHVGPGEAPFGNI